MNAGRREADFANIEVYDPATNTWAKKADIPTRRGALAVSEVNGKIYVIGGTQDRSLFLRTVQEAHVKVGGGDDMAFSDNSFLESWSIPESLPDKKCHVISSPNFYMRLLHCS